MATKHSRLNITLDPEHMGLLADFAEREKKSLSSVAKDLIALALDLQEDRHFSHVAAKRDTSKTRWISHDDAWKD